MQGLVSEKRPTLNIFSESGNELIILFNYVPAYQSHETFFRAQSCHGQNTTHHTQFELDWIETNQEIELY